MERVETGITSQEKYLEAKKKCRRTVYQVKHKPEWKRFGNIMQSDDQKCDVFKIAKRMVETKQDIFDECSIRNDDDVLAASDEDKKIAW